MRELSGHLKGKETKSGTGRGMVILLIIYNTHIWFSFFLLFFCLVSARGRTSNKRLQNYPGATWLQGHWHPHMIFYPIFYSIQILFIYLFIYLLLLTLFKHINFFFKHCGKMLFWGCVWNQCGTFFGGFIT